MGDLRDPPSQTGNAELLEETGNRRVQKERGFDRVDQVALGNCHFVDSASAPASLA